MPPCENYSRQSRDLLGLFGGRDVCLLRGAHRGLDPSTSALRASGRLGAFWDAGFSAGLVCNPWMEQTWLYFVCVCVCVSCWPLFQAKPRGTFSGTHYFATRPLKQTSLSRRGCGPAAESPSGDLPVPGLPSALGGHQLPAPGRLHELLRPLRPK